MALGDSKHKETFGSPFFVFCLKLIKENQIEKMPVVSIGESRCVFKDFPVREDKNLS